jgi:N-acetylmuramoyl-L-alanine amidase
MPPRWLLAVSVALGLVTLGLEVARARRARAAVAHPAVHPSAADTSRWPGEGSVLSPPVASFGENVVRVVLDPGHGAPNNSGNTSSYCIAEQDAMQDLAEAVAHRLEATGHIAVRLTRDPGRLVEYAVRLEDAARWGADAFVSLHSDVRGHLERWAPSAGLDCPIAEEAPGLAVLYSDEGSPGVVGHRRALGRAAARRMREAGFLAYDGAAYAGLYLGDETEEGLFVDRHAAEQRIFVLRRAAMPSILVETHNAVDPREAARWTEPVTIDAFAAALAAALADVVPRFRLAVDSADTRGDPG